jgi:hypothetical protein
MKEGASFIERSLSWEVKNFSAEEEIDTIL